MSRYLSFVISIVFVISCSPSNPKRDRIEDKSDASSKLDKVHLESLNLNPKLDVLFVIDDSGSMSSHQARLADNFILFLRELQKQRFLDYHIGIISTDNDNFGGIGSAGGDLKGDPAFVGRGLKNGLHILSRDLIVGTRGSGFEKMFTTSVAAITPPLINTTNQGFLREDAHLAILFITDAEDQSSMSATDYVEKLLSIKNDNIDLLSIFGAIVPVTPVRDCSRSSESPPKKIEQALALVAQAKGEPVGSNFFGLCDPEYGTKLAEIGRSLVKDIRPFVKLNELPIPCTLRVTYGTQILESDAKKGWVYDSKEVGIRFGTEIEVDQEPGAQLNVTFIPAKFQDQPKEIGLDKEQIKRDIARLCDSSKK